MNKSSTSLYFTVFAVFPPNFVIFFRVPGREGLVRRKRTGLIRVEI
jgi:hypothetical protein